MKNKKAHHRSVMIAILLVIAAIGSAAMVSAGPTRADHAAAVRIAPAGYEGLAWFPAGQALLLGRPGDVVPLDGPRALQHTELWIAPLDGRPSLRITANGVEPTFSPDGERISFLSHIQGDTWQRVAYVLTTEALERGKTGKWDALRSEAGGTTALRAEGIDGSWTVRLPAPAGGLHAILRTAAGPSTDISVEDRGTGSQWEVIRSARCYPSAPAWAPAGTQLAFSCTPAGSGGEGVVYLWEPAGSPVPIAAGRSPLWSPDGHWLMVTRSDGVWLHPVASPAAGAWSMPDLPAVPVPSEAVSLAAQLTPPATIRVLHSAANYYRSDVPPGQIDVFPFEEYVKRVVPYEMPRLWPAEALKAQTLAARSYAWWFVIRHTAWDFDVNDWTDYQVMGPDTFPETNASVEATRGQYLAHEGEVILAEFSAQNGSPTVARAGFPYLQAVDDPVCFGEARYGHGRGLSQEGARRWAVRYGWTYAQILLHYYAGITLEQPANSSPSPQAPIGAVVWPWNGFYTTSDHVLVRATASDGDGDVAGVRFWGQSGAGPAVPLGEGMPAFDGWYYLWDVSSLPDQALPSAGLVISATLRDAGGRSTSVPAIRIGLDRTPPAGSVAVPGTIAQPTLPLTVTLAGADTSGIAGLMVSDNWVWEGEELYHQENTGDVVADAAAWNDQAWLGRAGTDHAGTWYGPYTRAIPAGRPYRAVFRLKTNAITETRPIAVLDVAADGGAQIIGYRELRGTDFREAGTYQEFGVDFWHRGDSSTDLEFRVAFAGTADLYFDRVVVFCYPISFRGSSALLQWDIPDAAGTHTIWAKLADGAGNLSSEWLFPVTYAPATSTPTPSPTATVTVTSTPTPTRTPITPTATPTASPTSTPMPGGMASLSFSLGSIFADADGDGVRDAGEAALDSVRMWFVDAEDVPVVPPHIGSSWQFTASLRARSEYRLVFLKQGYVLRVEDIIAPPAGAEISMHWGELGLHPWDAGALLPIFPILFK